MMLNFFFLNGLLLRHEAKAAVIHITTTLRGCAVRMFHYFIEFLRFFWF